MKVVVCGSRYWTDLGRVLGRLEALPKFSTIIEGGCSGADGHALIAAHRLGHDVIEFPANWNGRGNGGGPYRNRLMLDMKPDLVIAFHEDIARSKGTKDMVNEAKRRGIPVEVIGK